MIGKKSPKRRAGRGSFVALKECLEHDLDGRRRIDVVASWSYGVGSHETAALEMEAVEESIASALDFEHRSRPSASQSFG